MWQLTSRFFLGISAAAIFTNAAAVYVLHDVDTDRIGNLNLAYGELTLEFFAFGVVLAVIFFLLAWIGVRVFRLRDISPNLKLGFALGIAVTIVQYPAEFAVRKLAAGQSTDSFLLSCLLLSPVCCATIILLGSHKRRIAKNEILGS
jgi:hypothetical protein